MLAAHDRGKPVAVAVLGDGSTVVLPDSCPHDGGLLSDGYIEGNTIVCARHGWEFDGHSGQCTHQPNLQVPCSVLAEGSGPVDS
jgi:nitrite reductase/ring-hydroxylating ferredoxin subunit